MLLDPIPEGHAGDENPAEEHDDELPPEDLQDGYQPPADAVEVQVEVDNHRHGSTPPTTAEAPGARGEAGAAADIVDNEDRAGDTASTINGRRRIRPLCLRVREPDQTLARGVADDMKICI